MTVENEKKRKHDVLTNKRISEMKYKTKITPYAMTWDKVLANNI
ncbi:hypothetical protein PAEPH01_2922 [Pancytospora epiphaga]|nr:hypothetical protein PAEPH01_2922 [Pancytospora epiphaga]